MGLARELSTLLHLPEFVRNFAARAAELLKRVPPPLFNYKTQRLRRRYCAECPTEPALIPIFSSV